MSTLVKDFSRIEQTRLLTERMPRIYIQDSLAITLQYIIKVHKFIVLFSIEIEIFAGDREHSFIVMI